MVDWRFHTEQLLWNGKRLPVILDHINGVMSSHRVTADSTTR
jgi:hypothetical protein